MAGPQSSLNVLIATPDRVLYEGEAQSVILPGERGVLELLPYHKAILTRLLAGRIVVDDKTMTIRRGVAKCAMNQVTVIVEENAA